MDNTSLNVLTMGSGSITVRFLHRSHRRANKNLPPEAAQVAVVSRLRRGLRARAEHGTYRSWAPTPGCVVAGRVPRILRHEGTLARGATRSTSGPGCITSRAAADGPLARDLAS